MLNSGMVSFAAALFAAPAAVPAQEYEYSIRFFFDWHRQLFKDITCWSMQNGYSLLIGGLGVVITVCLCLGLLLMIRRIAVPVVERRSRNAAKALTAVSRPVVWVVFWFGFSISLGTIPFSAAMHQVLDKIFYICFILAFLSIFRHALQCAASLMIVRFKQGSPENYNMNKLLLDLSLSIVRLIVWIFVVIFIFQEVFHLKVTHLIASAGIFGLAVAFAAKDTIANVFGAFAILGSKMFRVGDWIKAGSTEGIVEQIGIRSIRIRAFSDGRQIDIPNHIIADSQIENFSNRLYWREYFCFGLVYQTTPEQMALAQKILADIGKDLADLLEKGRPVQFDFALFDRSSLNLEGYVWFGASDFLAMRRARGRFNEEVLRRFNAAGLEFAFPTTTVVMENPEKK